MLRPPQDDGRAAELGPMVTDEDVPMSAGGSVKTPVAVQLLLPEMGEITGFYEARTVVDGHSCRGVCASPST